MGKEARWVAVILCVVLVTMMIVMPRGGRGRLPTLDELEEKSKTPDCSIPVIGPLLCKIAEAFRDAASKLELDP